MYVTWIEVLLKQVSDVGPSISSCFMFQHFPMYRVSDSNCSTPDAAPSEEKEIEFRPKWDCLSKNSTEMVLQ